MEQIGDEYGVFQSFLVSSGESMGRGSPELLLGIHNHPDVGPESELWLRAAMRYYTWKAPYRYAIKHARIQSKPEEKQQSERKVRKESSGQTLDAGEGAVDAAKLKSVEQRGGVREKQFVAMMRKAVETGDVSTNTATSKRKGEGSVGKQAAQTVGSSAKKKRKVEGCKEAKVAQAKNITEKGDWFRNLDLPDYIREILTSKSSCDDFDQFGTCNCW